MKDKSLLEVAHEIANDLYNAGIMDATTLREFDAEALPKIDELSPRKIKQIRLKQKVSQTVFAKFLNTTTSTIRQWEQGTKHPRGTSLKLLTLVEQKGLEVLV